MHDIFGDPVDAKVIFFEGATLCAIILALTFAVFTIAAVSSPLAEIVVETLALGSKRHFQAQSRQVLLIRHVSGLVHVESHVESFSLGIQVELVNSQLCLAKPLASLVVLFNRIVSLAKFCCPFSEFFLLLLVDALVGVFVEGFALREQSRCEKSQRDRFLHYKGASCCSLEFKFGTFLLKFILK